MAIKQQLKQEEPSSYQLVILNADKLVDQAMQDRGIKGSNMGERLKNATTVLTDVQKVWTAHKMRNHIAHETDVQITYDDVRFALYNFEKALKDLGAI